jgi:hypothetical protein
MLSEYENNKTTLSIMRPIVRSLKTLIFGKDSDGKYYVDEFIRNLVINAYLKYEPARYLEVTFDATRGAMSYDLTQNVAMGARISLLRSIRGQLATLAEDGPTGNPEESRKAVLLNELIDYKYITKKFELTSIEESQRKQRISDIFSILFNIEIDEQLILKNDITKIENLIQECLNILKKESTPKKVIDETGIYNAGIQSFENFQALTILGKIMASSSATKYAKSVIKNGEGNNVPTSQLPNYITQ